VSRVFLMNNLLTLGGASLLLMAAWPPTARAGPPGSAAPHRILSLGSIEGLKAPPSYIEPMGMVLPTHLTVRSRLFPGQLGPRLVSTSGLMMGGAHPITAHHLAGLPGHLPAGTGETQVGSAQPGGAGDSGLDQPGAATMQPNPAASAWSPRPLGAGGPGRLVSGHSGPGRPVGPGLRAGPR
jgi:hypothetical protein